MAWGGTAWCLFTVCGGYGVCVCGGGYGVLGCLGLGRTVCSLSSVRVPSQDTLSPGRRDLLLLAYLVGARHPKVCFLSSVHVPSQDLLSPGRCSSPQSRRGRRPPGPL